MRYSFWILAGLVLLLDQVTKLLVTCFIPLGDSIPLLPGFLWLTHVHNPGAAFGQLRGAGPVLVLMASAAVVGILLYRRRLLQAGGRLHPLLSLGLSLALGGAVGNMIDRMRQGSVVDFLDLRWWPIFNVADSAITVGAVSLVLYFLVIASPAAEPAPEPAAEAGE